MLPLILARKLVTYKATYLVKVMSDVEIIYTNLFDLRCIVYDWKYIAAFDETDKS